MEQIQKLASIRFITFVELQFRNDPNV